MAQKWLEWLKNWEKWKIFVFGLFWILIVLYILKVDLNQLSLFGETFWEWIRFVVIPLTVPITLASLTFRFQQQQQKRLADEKKEEILQNYYDRISSILLQGNLLEASAKLFPSPDKEVQEIMRSLGFSQGFKDLQEDEFLEEIKISNPLKFDLTPELKSIIESIRKESVTVSEKAKLDTATNMIRAQTLLTLRRLEDDSERKTSVIRFLVESEIFGKIRLNLDDANFRRANLAGLNLRLARLNRANFIDANIRRTYFAFSSLAFSQFNNAETLFADFSFANLISANFESTDLKLATFTSANLNRSNLILANLELTDFSQAQLNEANLKGASFYRTVLNGATFNKASLAQATLNSVILWETDFSNSVFIDTQLVDVDFSKAILNSTIFLATDLRKTKITIDQLTGDKKAYICGVALPSNVTDIQSDRDCDILSDLLEEEYYLNPKEAQRVVREARGKKWG